MTLRPMNSLNGYVLEAPDDDAYDLIMAVASGRLEYRESADALKKWVAAQHRGAVMIFIVVKFETKPEWTDRWPELVAPFTEATRAEEGNLWFDWSRSLENPAEYVLVEAFRDGDAGAAHVNSEHFKAAQRDLPQALASTPKVISENIDATGWSKLAEISVD